MVYRWTWMSSRCLVLFLHFNFVSVYCLFRLCSAFLMYFIVHIYVKLLCLLFVALCRLHVSCYYNYDAYYLYVWSVLVVSPSDAYNVRFLNCTASWRSHACNDIWEHLRVFLFFRYNERQCELFSMLCLNMLKSCCLKWLESREVESATLQALNIAD